MDLTKVWKSVSTTVTKHSPEILVGLGIGGMITGAILGIAATPKAVRTIDRKKRISKIKQKPYTRMDAIKDTWYYYIPCGLTIIFSGSMIVAGTCVSLKRNAALTAAYTASTKALIDYQAKTREVVGEKKEQKIREELAKDAFTDNSSVGAVVLTDPYANCIVIDEMLGRDKPIISNYNDIMAAVNSLNARLINDGYVSLAEWYDVLECHSSSKISGSPAEDMLGWNAHSTGLFEPHIESCTDDKNRPALFIRHGLSRPVGDYKSY